MILNYDFVMEIDGTVLKRPNLYDADADAPMLWKTLEHIEAHPKEWWQGSWRCGTGMCYAGHAATIAGGVWFVDNPTSEDADQSIWDDLDGQFYGDAETFMLAEDEDDPAEIVTFEGQKIIHVWNRAQRLLRTNEMATDLLFAGTNGLEDLREYVQMITGEER